MNLSREERAAWLERLCDTMSKQMNHAIERGNAPLARVYAIFLARTAFKIDRSLRDVVRRMNGFSAIHTPYSTAPDFKHGPPGADQAAWASGRRSRCSTAAASVATTPAS